MINLLKRIQGKLFKSLRLGMLVTIVLSIFLSVSCAVLTRGVFRNWIENKYNSKEAKKERYEDYVADLQGFVDKKQLSSNDTAEILKWVSSNRNIYLFIYKNDELFFDSSIAKPDEEAEKDEDSSSGESNGDTENGEDEGVNDNATQSGETPEDEENQETESTESKTDEEKDDGGAAGGGFTVQYPTREEIIASAKNNGQMPLEMSDGSLLVSIADFTEYIYYDIANIVSIAVGVLILTLILMLYFQNILTKISVLAKDVTNVYEVDMNTPIRTLSGGNELAVLTRNVEEMRSSMMESLKKEKEAINANTELITSMSHDIRTPLTVLLGYIDIMKNTTDDPNMQEYIKASEITAMRLKDLSDDMFRYFLVFGEGDIKADILVYSAGTFFTQLLSEHVLLLLEKGYLVDFIGFDEIGDSVYVRTDAPKMMRVVDNVFSNIYKYADRDEKIIIKASVVEDYVCVEIVNGIASLKNEAESHGVGLRTCAKICEALGAYFEYSRISENNEKFKVEIRLPRAEGEERVVNEA